MAKAVKTPKTNAMRELESAGISYVLHTYEDDGDESVGPGGRDFGAAWRGARSRI